MRLPDEVWEVISSHISTYKGYTPHEGLRKVIEEHTNIELFDGGAFVAMGNEFDIFVAPRKRGHWQIRKVGDDYLNRMGKKYGRVVAKIDERNTVSMRLANFFGFRAFAKSGSLVHMEKVYG